MGDTYWQLIEPIWNEVNIYDGPEVFLDSYSRIASEVAALYAAHFCQSEVCNGGFRQFFSNSTGVLAPEAVQGFHAIGQNRIADLVERAMLAFGSPYIRDRERRHEILENLPARSFDSLDEEFFSLIEKEAGGFEAAAEPYATTVRGS